MRKYSGCIDYQFRFKASYSCFADILVGRNMGKRVDHLNLPQ